MAHCHGGGQGVARKKVKPEMVPEGGRPDPSTCARAAQVDDGPGVYPEMVPGLLGERGRSRDRHLDGTLIEGEWQEIKLGLVAGWQDGQLVNPSYMAARETAASFALRLGTEGAGWQGGVVKLSRATATCCGVRLPPEYYLLWFGAST
jgi:hypothetical protein